jgi:hypothetical protein
VQNKINHILNLSKQLQLTKSESKSAAYLAHFSSVGSFFFYSMAFFLVGGGFLNMKIIRETTEIKMFFSKLINLSMKFGSL